MHYETHGVLVSLPFSRALITRLLNNRRAYDALTVGAPREENHRYTLFLVHALRFARGVALRFVHAYTLDYYERFDTRE